MLIKKISTFAESKYRTFRCKRIAVLERWQSGRLWRSRKPLYLRVPGVRIPLSPLNVTDKTGQRTDKSHKFNDLWDFFYPLVSALKYIFSPLKDKVSNLTRTPDKQNQKGGTDSRKLANFCRCLASLHKTHF